MATTTRNQPRTTYHEEYEMTVFGRRWEPGRWLAPIISWVVVVIVAAGINLAQRHDLIPASGRGLLTNIAAFTALAALLGLAFGGRAGMHRTVAAWCTFTPLAAGVWTAFAAVFQLNSSMWPMLTWLVLLVVGSVLYRIVCDIQRNYELTEIYAEAERITDEQMAIAVSDLDESKPGVDVDPDAQKWQDWMEKAGLPGMIFLGRYIQRNSGGVIIHFELPDSGDTSYDMVESRADKLELLVYKTSWLRSLFQRGVVRPGSVRVQRACDEFGDEVVGELLVFINTVDILKKTLRMPTGKDAYTPISIMDAFQVGEFIDGDPIMLTIHEMHILIVGQTQHGKSNLLHIMIRQLARCNDALIWGMDFKGGDTIRLWMNPYMDGEIDPHTNRPLAQGIFDWVAVDNLPEAERMLLACLEAANSRPVIVGGGGWVPSPERPAIILIGEEISQVVGSKGGLGGRSPYHVSPDELSAILTDVTKLGAGMGIYVITTNQRGVVGEVGSGSTKSQQRGRIVLPVTEGRSDVLQSSSEEARRQAKGLKHPGSVVIEGWGVDGKPGKIWLAGKKTEIKAKIRHEVMALTHLRAGVQLDHGTKMAILKYGYEGRPGGPTPDPDRIAWYYGDKTRRPVLTWDHTWGPDGKPVRISDQTGPAGGTATAVRPKTTAEALGLGHLPSILTDDDRPAKTPATTPVSSVPGPRRATTDADDGVDPDWAAEEREVLAELGLDKIAEHVAATPELNPAPTDPAAAISAGRHTTTIPVEYTKPTFENTADLMIDIIHGFGPNGGTGADLHRGMGDRAPHPGTIYKWLDKLMRHTARNDRDDRVVIQHGDVFMTKANKPMPTKGA